MTNKDNFLLNRNKQAFPLTHEFGFNPGFTKREMLAAIAMHGYIGYGYKAEDAAVEARIATDQLLKQLEDE